MVAVLTRVHARGSCSRSGDITSFYPSHLAASPETELCLFQTTSLYTIDRFPFDREMKRFEYQTCFYCLLCIYIDVYVAELAKHTEKNMKTCRIQYNRPEINTTLLKCSFVVCKLTQSCDMF